MFALLATVLMGAGALAVDVGQVYAKRAALQGNVDMAVLAAAAELDGGATCNSDVVDAAQAYLTKAGNEVAGQKPLNLTDGDDANGEIYCDQWTVRLVAPEAVVDLGLARAVYQPAPDGDPSDDYQIDVPAAAAAGIFSPDTAVMPAYAVQGCDYGPQTLVDDSASADPPIPPMPEDTPTDTALDIDSLTPTSTEASVSVDLSIAGNPALANAKWVAFSRATSDTNEHYEFAPTSAVSKLVTVVPVPSYVINTPGVWYVRVSQQPTNPTTWSNALPFLVGDAMLECEPGPDGGNFGALRLYRDPDPDTNTRLALNMAKGLDFSVTTFPSPAIDWRCTHGVNGAVESTNSTLRDGTNCVPTDTGLPATATEAGMITGEGLGGVPGKLDGRPTDPACGSDQSINFGGSVGSRTVNWDYLTCFFIDGTTRIQDLGESYAGPAVIDERILDSPRFLWVPVLGTDPSTGMGGERYQIVDFRPAFITDQPATATRDVPMVAAENGIGLKPLGPGKYTLRSLKVVFFDVDALPESVANTGPVMTYLGVGPKIISLTE